MRRGRQMAARKTAEPKIADAAERTGSLIRDLQSRLRGEPVKEQSDESPDDLERQLQEYFGSTQPNILNEIRNRVIEGVVERILREWDSPAKGSSTPIENEVITRLIDRGLERLGKA